MLRIIAGLFLFLIIHLALAESAMITLSVKQQKIEVPFWASKKTGNGIVIVVGDNEGSLLLHPLSEQIAAFGWSVVLLKSEKDLPWLEQLPEALSALRQKNNKRMVVIHYGDQLKELLDYFAKPQSKQVNALILLSSYDLPAMPAKVDKAEEKSKSPLKFRFAVLDIAGQFDYPAVLEQYTLRKTRFAPDNYRQLTVPGATHDYSYQQGLLASFINGKMSKLTVPKLSRPPIPIR